MASLKETLLQYSKISTPFSDEERIHDSDAGPAPTPPPKFDRAGFLKEVRAIRKRNEVYFYVCIAMAVTLFIVSIFVVINNLHESGVVKTAMAGFGITTAGVLSWTFKSLRTKNVTEVLIMMAPEVNDDLLRLIIETLARRL